MELGVTIPPFIRPDHPADDSRAGRRSPTSGESERRRDTPCDLMLPARQTRPRLHHHLGESDPLRYLRAGGQSPMRVRVPFHQRGSNCVHSSSRLSPLLPPTHEKERQRNNNFQSEAGVGPVVSLGVRWKTRRSFPTRPPPSPRGRRVCCCGRLAQNFTCTPAVKPDPAYNVTPLYSHPALCSGG